MRKPKIALDISTTGKGGGPYSSTINLINSELNEKYNFVLFEYDTKLGRFISIKRILNLRKQLRSINPDIVHFSGLQLSGFHIAIACLLAGVQKRIVVIHGSSMESMSIGIVKKGLIGILEVFTLLLSTRFYGVSNYASNLTITSPFKKKNFGCIYNLPTYKSKEKPKFNRENFGFSMDDIIITTVARIVKEKGYETLTSVIKKFNDIANVKFLIIGDGAYLSKMKSDLKNEEGKNVVKFLGHRDDVLSILSICDIFVLPTLHETLSISLLEASYVGLPLVASNVGGVSEIINDGYNGILVRPSNVQELYIALLKLSLDPLLREQLGRNSKILLEKKFDTGLIVKKVDELYMSVLNS